MGSANFKMPPDQALPTSAHISWAIKGGRIFKPQQFKNSHTTCREVTANVQGFSRTMIGYIYLMVHSHDQSIVKVGRTNDPKRRLAEHNAALTSSSLIGSWSFLTTILVDDMIRAEQAAHEALSRSRDPVRREQFKITPRKAKETVETALLPFTERGRKILAQEKLRREKKEKERKLIEEAEERKRKKEEELGFRIDELKEERDKALFPVRDRETHGGAVDQIFGFFASFVLGIIPTIFLIIFGTGPHVYFFWVVFSLVIFKTTFAVSSKDEAAHGAKRAKSLDTEIETLERQLQALKLSARLEKERDEIAVKSERHAKQETFNAMFVRGFDEKKAANEKIVKGLRDLGNTNKESAPTTSNRFRCKEIELMGHTGKPWVANLHKNGVVTIDTAAGLKWFESRDDAEDHVRGIRKTIRPLMGNLKDVCPTCDLEPRSRVNLEPETSRQNKNRTISDAIYPSKCGKNQTKKKPLEVYDTATPRVKSNHLPSVSCDHRQSESSAASDSDQPAPERVKVLMTCPICFSRYNHWVHRQKGTAKCMKCLNEHNI